MSTYHYPSGPRLNATNTTNGFMLTGETPSTPERRTVLLALAKADGQPWTSDQGGSGWTDHMGEMMYGKLADAVEGLVTTARAEAWDEGWHTCNRIYTEQFTGAGLGCTDNPYRTEER